MNEDILLEKTLEIAENHGYKSAYQYLLDNKDTLGEGDYPSVWYFLCCLASGAGDYEAAINHLKKSVDECGYWYRPEVLEDDDLVPIMENQEFIRLKTISDNRYHDALNQSKTLWSWKNKQKNNILLCLHGNGQTAEISRSIWKQLENNDLQIETLQSHTVDSFERFRWNYDEADYKQINDCINHIQWDSYKYKYLAGFSAGCDMMLRAITLTDITCDEILLQSPWIPFINENLQQIIDKCKEKQISVRIYCGELDVDCKEMATRLYNNMKQNDVKVDITWQQDLRHQFPEKLGNEYQFFGNIN
jgi:hypothetical protein